MDPKTWALLVDLVIVPLVQELLRRRSIHGATKENLLQFSQNHKEIVKALQQSPTLRRDIITDLADAIDNVGAEAVNAAGELFAAITPGGGHVDDTD